MHTVLFVDEAWPYANSGGRNSGGRLSTKARTIGLVFTVLLFGPIIALSSAGEPPLDATAAEGVTYFGNIEATWAQLAMSASTLGWIGSLWFFVSVGCLLRRAERDPPWRSTIATLSGTLLAAYGLVGASPAGAGRVLTSADPGVITSTRSAQT